MHPHRSNALHDAHAVLTVTLWHVVAVSLSRSWSRQPQARACLAAFALRDTLGRTPYYFRDDNHPNTNTHNRTTVHSLSTVRVPQ